MNRNQAKELLPIIKAFSEGKDVEYFDEGSDKWRICVLPQFDYNVKYRIKSEIKYRPFKNAEECWQEMQKHQPFGWIRNKFNTGGVIATIIFLDSRKGFKIYTDFGQGNTPEDMMNSFVFADGTPFGILEEE